MYPNSSINVSTLVLYGVHLPNSNPSTHRNPWDPDPSRLDAVGGKNRVFCVCFGKPMLPSVEEELQQWMEDNHVSVLELKSFADRMLKEVAIIPF